MNIEIVLYHPLSFGSLQSGQSYQSGKSRYGFNGMEMDNEIGITGKDYTTEFREYNTDISRWWSLDPKPTASESWYAGMGNNPILFTDLRGDSAFVFGEDMKYQNKVDDGNAEWSINVLQKKGNQTTTQVFKLNDPKNDPDRIELLINKYGNKTQFLFLKSEKDEQKYMKNVGLDKPFLKYVPIDYYLARSSYYSKELSENSDGSKNSGKYDFWSSQIGPELKIKFKNSIEYQNLIGNDGAAFFLINNKAYNDMDYGNRLFGKATGYMRLPLWFIKMAADINNQKTHKGLHDDPADQRAIEDGQKSVK